MSAYDNPWVPIAEDEKLLPSTVNLERDKPRLPPCSVEVPHSQKRKNGSSLGDKVLLQYMAPDRPDIAEEGRKKVLDTSSPSPPRKRNEERDNPGERSPEVHSPENLDDLLFREQQQQDRKEEERKRREPKRPISPGTRSLFPNVIDISPRDSPEPNESEHLKRERPSPESKTMALTQFPLLGDMPPKTSPDMTEPHVINQRFPGVDGTVQANSMLVNSKAPPHQLKPLKIENIDSVFIRPNGNIIRDPPHTARLVRETTKLPRRDSLPASFREGTDYSMSESLAQSPVAQHIRHPPTPAHKLPPFQKTTGPSSPQTASSPQNNQTLPPIGPVIALADEVTTRQRGSSISQVGPSPTYHAFSNHGSPTDSTTSPTNYPTPSFSGPPTFFRRPSIASDNPYSAPLRSASTASESHTSPDGAFSPSETLGGTTITTPSERSIRLGPPLYQNGPSTPHQPMSTATSPQSGIPPGYMAEPTVNGHHPNGTPNGITNKLPLPTPSSAQQQSAVQTTGQYRCPFPNCSASAFQTQYLLNSHTTVHSSDRPHFCPQPGCPRGPGGQGFKRKNEMKRHGLVHDSPGYICPFCPEREHRYPRPDNLQRHVRVHHADVQTNDPKLREVLEKKTGMGRGSGTRRRARGHSLSGLGLGVGVES
jgi:hypothetical protein